MTKNKVIALTVGAAVVGFVLGLSLAPQSNLGGLVQNLPQSFIGGLNIGTSDQFAVGTDGALTTSGSITGSGAVSLSSTLTVTGETNVSNLIQGDADGSAASVTTATSTVTAAQVCDNSLIVFSAVSTPATTTLPHATSTVADCLTADGDHRTLFLQNASSTGVVAIATSTGDLLFIPTNATSTAATNAILDAGDYAKVDMLRVNSTTVLFTFTELITQ